MRYSPEQALLRILEDLKVVLKFEPIHKITPAGSVVLGTYVNDPDIDIIVECVHPHGVMAALQRFYPHGYRKIGKLTIWHVPKVYGYPVDFVLYGEKDERTQTLKHVEYFQNILTDEMREKVKKLKSFFKDINCYNAEVGGITGVCITRMAEIYHTMEQALATMTTEIGRTGDFFVEDPVLKGRNLFASVTELKKKFMVQEAINFVIGNSWSVRDLSYFFDIYSRIYRIRRIKSMGTDREFQFVYGSVNRVWKKIKNRIKWWNVWLDFDILVEDKDIYIGMNIYPSTLDEPAIELIPIEVLNKASIEKLKKLGAKPNKDLSYLKYERKPPFKNVMREFEKALYARLSEKYIELERM